MIRWMRTAWLARRMGWLLARQVVWSSEVIKFVGKQQPERAKRMSQRMLHLLNRPKDPADPLRDPREITEYLLNELHEFGIETGLAS